MNDRVQTTIRNLMLNGFDVQFFQTGKEAAASLVQQVDPNESVGFGGSMTVSDLDIYEKLVERGCKASWHWRSASAEDRKAALAQAAQADVYITGTNAITEDGRLVNIDGTGNRLSGMLYGHDRVCIVAGVNKICRNLDEAMIRIKNTAAPLNAVRLGIDTPCRHLGKCMNCDSPQRICHATLILDRRPNAVKTTIYLIDEKLGY